MARWQRRPWRRKCWPRWPQQVHKSQGKAATYNSSTKKVENRLPITNKRAVDEVDDDAEDDDSDFDEEYH